MEASFGSALPTSLLEVPLSVVFRVDERRVVSEASLSEVPLSVVDLADEKRAVFEAMLLEVLLRAVFSVGEKRAILEAMLLEMPVSAVFSVGERRAIFEAGTCLKEADEEADVLLMLRLGKADTCVFCSFCKGIVAISKMIEC